MFYGGEAGALYKNVISHFIKSSSGSQVGGGTVYKSGIWFCGGYLSVVIAYWSWLVSGHIFERMG